ncbi:MAG: hypothetical protein AAGA60_02430 [Cyanobacteria bacterium P01_E01_bin.42]
MLIPFVPYHRCYTEIWTGDRDRPCKNTDLIQRIERVGNNRDWQSQYRGIANRGKIERE